MVVFTLNFLHSRVDAKLKEVGVGGTQAHQLELPKIPKNPPMTLNFTVLLTMESE